MNYNDGRSLLLQILGKVTTDEINILTGKSIEPDDRGEVVAYILREIPDSDKELAEKLARDYYLAIEENISEKEFNVRVGQALAPLKQYQKLKNKLIEWAAIESTQRRYGL